jgi:hypothetical protein
MMPLLPDQKFSTFQLGGDLEVGDIVVGLRGGINTQFDWTVPTTVDTLTGTANQVLVNGTSGSPITGDVVLSAPQDIAPTSSPTFANVQVDGSILGDNGLPVMQITSLTGAISWVEAVNNVSGGIPGFRVISSDPDVYIALRSKGGGGVQLQAESTIPVQWLSGTGLQHVTNFSIADTNQNRTVTFQDASGTLAFLSDIPSGTPSALTKTDDINVTLTLGGTPATALLQPTSLTLGWTGQLGLTRGGTGASLTASNGGIVYSTAGALAILSGTATAGQIIRSGSSTTPSWSTSTYPSSNAANTLLYASSANVMAALPTANNGILVTSAGGVPSIGNTIGAGITLPSITFNSTTGIVGTTTNNNAAAGSVGEFVSSVVLLASAVTVAASGTPKDMTSISLTAGDWDVWGNIFLFESANVTGFTMWSSTTSATLPDLAFISSFTATSAIVGGIGNMIPTKRYSLSSTTTIYISGQANYASTAPAMCGGLYARRVR